MDNKAVVLVGSQPPPVIDTTSHREYYSQSILNQHSLKSVRYYHSVPQGVDGFQLKQPISLDKIDKMLIHTLIG